MKMHVFGVLIIASLLCLSCSTFSGYVSYYKPYVDAHTLPNVTLLAENEEPKIYTTNNMANDVLDVESNHFAVIGYSSFNGAEEGINGITAICKRTGAKLALYSVQYTNTQNNSGSLVLPKTQTTNTYGNVYTSSGSSAWYNGTSTTNGTTVIPYSYNVRRYDQEAVYFVQLTNKFKLGVSWGPMTNEIQQRIQRNNGVVIRVVYKDTPAFRANVLNGDVIIGMDGEDISSPDDVNKILDKHAAGDEIELVIMRSIQEKNITVKLD